MASRSNDTAFAARLRLVGERFRQSLFFVPAFYVVGAIVAAIVSIIIDRAVKDDFIPSIFLSTVESARAMLLAIVSGTISAVAIVFSLTLIAVQLAASQFSPRTLRTFIGDRFQHHVMGVLLLTVVFSLLVLSEVQAVENGPNRVPDVSVAAAIALAVASLLALLASVDRTARNLQVGRMIGRIASETMGIVLDRLPEREEDPSIPEAPVQSPALPDEELGAVPEDAVAVESKRTGWVQQLALSSVLNATPDGATVRVEVAVGSYVSAGMPLVWIWPPPDEEDDDVGPAVRNSIVIGGERTMQEDLGYGILRLVDMGLRALSPGINDPNTAEEVIARLGSIVLEIMTREVAAKSIERDGRRLILPQNLAHDDYVSEAFDQLRLAAVDDPHVLNGLLRTLGDIAAELQRRGFSDVEPLREQARLIISGLAVSRMPDADRERVEAEARRTLLGGTSSG